MWHVGIEFEQFVGLLLRDKRIHEERTRRAYFSDRRKFRHACLNDFLAHFSGIAGFDAIDHGSDDIFAFKLVLESAVPITETAFSIGKDALLKCLHIERVNRKDDIFCLHSVGSHILYRGRPYFTGNETQFLESTILHVGQLGDEIIEPQAILCFYRFIIDESRPSHRRVQDDAVEILGKQ